MRLIDLDSLPNYKLMGIMTFEGEKSPAELRIVLWEDIESMPIVDAVPVVRCARCRHYHADIGWCDQLSYFQTSDGEPCSPAESMDWKMFQENDYCSMGQRKEAAHEQ